jgi:hypothetical protein
VETTARVRYVYVHVQISVASAGDANVISAATKTNNFVMTSFLRSRRRASVH